MRKALALAVMALPLALAGCAEHDRSYYSGPYAPTHEERFAQRGFHDGFDAARHEMSRGWRLDADRHGSFRNPPVPRRAVDDYRHGFRQGYERAFRGDRDHDRR